MRIAIDTRDLSFAATGTRTYLVELLAALHSQQVGDITIIELNGLRWGTFLSRPTLANKFMQQLSLLFWKQLILPFRCLMARAEILICTDYFLPILPCGAKKIVVFHDALFFDKPQYYPKPWLLYFKWVVLPAAHRAAAIVTPSFFSRERLIVHFPAWSKKLHVIYQGPKRLKSMDTISPAGAKVMDRLKGAPFFLHVGAFEKRKNIPLLLAAFATFARRHDARLLLIGFSSGKYFSDDSAAILNFIKLHQLEDRVILGGYLPDGDLSFFYREAIAYVFPSLYEGFGIPLLESFMLGLPVASATGTALEEVAADAAIYFDPLSEVQLVSCLEQLYDSESLRQELIKKGLLRAQKFRWSESVRDFIALAKSL
jgi:glycosyltransferase involved in cell wall biosynthesis